MAQFNLSWFNTAVITNSNATGQRVSHRQKSVGGAYITAGYTPANDLPTTASNIQSPVLANNVIWEFKVECLCQVGGPIPNNNGNREGLKFACITPSLSWSTNTGTIVLNVAGLDITSATFILRRLDNDVIQYGPTNIARVGNSISTTATGLDPDESYYWEIIMYATVNGVQIASNDVNQLNDSCFSGEFKTDEDVCGPITDMDASVVELNIS